MPIDLYNPTPAHRELRRRCREFAERELEPGAAQHDRAETFDLDAFRKLGDLRLFGLTVPESYGGAGLDATAAVLSYEELSASDPGFALSCLAHSVLFANHLARHGSEAQRQRFLPDACMGRVIGGMAVSEPSGGTDVAAMQTTARRDGDRYILDGSKMWITNAVLDARERGDVFLVYARTSDRGVRGVSLFLVTKHNPGLTLGKQVQGRLGVRASKSAELVFRDCAVPIEDRVGEEGTALLRMMRTLELERLTMAAMGLGIARRCLEIMNRYASERRSFGRPLREFGQIQRHVAESYAELMAGRAYVYQTAARLDLDKPSPLPDADAAKLYCASMALAVADRSIQVLGAYGYSGEYPLERLWRDARLLSIGGGTAEAHQRNVTRQLLPVLHFE